MRKYLAGFSATSLLSLALLTGATMGAHAAAVLPDAVSSVSCNFGGVAAADPAHCFVDAGGTFGSATASASLGTFSPAITAGAGTTTFTLGGPNYTGSATASLTYYFQVLGPADGTPVPIVIAANLVAGPYHTPGVYGNASILAAGVGRGVCAGGQLCIGTQFQGDLLTTVNTGTAQQVQLSLSVSDSGPYFTSTSGFAGASIFIDPTFADADKYTIQFSNGIGPVIGVPEPATWAMFLLGFGAIGFAMRRQKLQRPV